MLAELIVDSQKLKSGCPWSKNNRLTRRLNILDKYALLLISFTSSVALSQIARTLVANITCDLVVQIDMYQNETCLLLVFAILLSQNTKIFSDRFIMDLVEH